MRNINELRRRPSSLFFTNWRVGVRPGANDGVQMPLSRKKFFKNRNKKNKKSKIPKNEKSKKNLKKRHI